MKFEDGWKEGQGDTGTRRQGDGMKVEVEVEVEVEDEDEVEDEVEWWLLSESRTSRDRCDPMDGLRTRKGEGEKLSKVT